MSGDNNRCVVRGLVAGAGAGLAASWVMNLFISGPGAKLHESLETSGERLREQEEQRHQQERGETKVDATMNAADAIAATATGGKHLSMEARQKGGPIVHYAFGALAGALYGVLVEVAPAARAGFGTAFGGVLFAGADLAAVPAFRLSPPITRFPAKSLATPFTAHLVYGATTELVRRAVRAVL